MKLDLRDVRFEAFRGRGPGGQHKNKTETCIRATHIPTGLVAVATSERSQTQNKQEALKILTGKVSRLADDRRAERKRATYDAKPDAAFGHQIRTYRLVGEQMATDHRTGISLPVDAVLRRGQIDEFLMAAIRA